VTWAENSLYQIGKEMYSGVKENDSFRLAEVVVGAEALHEIAEELLRRSAQ
jgi:hypothetical protein